MATHRERQPLSGELHKYNTGLKGFVREGGEKKKNHLPSRNFAL